METARQTALMEQPEIVELFRVLESSGLKKEQKEVEFLVKYLDGMKSQFGQVLEELRDVKEQLSQIQDGGVKASVLRIAEQAQSKVQEVGGQFNTVRKNLIQSAKSALQTFKEKGKDALQKAVSAMKMLDTIYKMEGVDQTAIKTAEGSYAVIDFLTDKALQPRRQSLDDPDKTLAFATLQIVDESYVTELERYAADNDLTVDMDWFAGGKDLGRIYNILLA